MQRTTTLIIGAGQAGLATSRNLSDQNIDHVLIERGQVANAWRTKRWDSLRLLTPNWQSRLPGYAYDGPDPDGFRTMPETVAFFDGYATQIGAPVQTNTRVNRVTACDEGYKVSTNQGDWTCRTLVIASGVMNTPAIPACAGELPPTIRSMSSKEYRNPAQIEDGGVLVVGPSASGVQIAQELKLAGRDVVLSVGEHVRLPRTYRGKDILWLMDQAGLFDVSIDEVDDVNRVRHLPSMQLVGSPTRVTISLNSLQALGIEIVGRAAGFRDQTAMFSGALANVCQLADLKMNRLLRSFDEWIGQQDMREAFDPAYDLRPTKVPETPSLSIDLADRGIKTVIWATGFKPDYSWLDLPVLDRKGQLRHDGGVVDAPGVYAMGLPFMRKRKSSFIDGAADDAHAIAQHLGSYVDAGHRIAA